jgi:hypothetical protein
MTGAAGSRSSEGRVVLGCESSGGDDQHRQEVVESRVHFGGRIGKECVAGRRGLASVAIRIILILLSLFVSRGIEVEAR